MLYGGINGPSEVPKQLCILTTLLTSQPGRDIRFSQPPCPSSSTNRPVIQTVEGSRANFPTLYNSHSPQISRTDEPSYLVRLRQNIDAMSSPRSGPQRRVTRFGVQDHGRKCNF